MSCMAKLLRLCHGKHLEDGDTVKVDIEMKWTLVAGQFEAVAVKGTFVLAILPVSFIHKLLQNDVVECKLVSVA